MGLNLVMLGAPGAGKGTQAERFARSKNIPKISTGDILRDAVTTGSEVGLRAKQIMDRGELVSDDEMIGIVTERLNRPDAVAGFVLDGFPRTVPQAAALDSIMNGKAPLVVVDIAVPEAELLRRLGARMICVICGHNAGTFVDMDGELPDAMMAPAMAGVAVAEALRCGFCGGRLVQRADDTDFVVRERLKVYHDRTEPLIEYYRGRSTFYAINGAQTADRVAADLVAAIEAARGGSRARGVVPR